MKKIQFIIVSLISLSIICGFSEASILSKGLLESWLNNSDYKDNSTVFKGVYDKSKDEYYICAGDESYCGSSHDIFHITYNNSSDTSYICAGSESYCGSSHDIFQIKGSYICPGNVTCSKSNSLYIPYFLIPIESIISILEGDNSSYSCDSRASSCTISSAFSQTKKGSDKYYICPGGQSSCSSQNDFLQVKQNDDKYYICGGGEINCSSINDILWIKKNSDKYYLCNGDDVSCSNINDILWIKKDSDKYYSCAGNKVSCSNQNSYIKTMTKGDGGNSSSTYYDTYYDDYMYTKDIADAECRDEFGSNSEAKSDDYNKCVCKHGYLRNANQTACIKYTKEKADSDCKSQYGLYSEAESDNYYMCTCTEGYIFNENKTKCVIDETYGQIEEMLAQDKKCQDRYGEHSIFADKCICVDGYIRNNNGTACIQQPNTDTSYNSNTDTYNNSFSQEYNNAYQFAFANKITTMPTIEQANMYGEIIRAEIAKMLSNWVKSLGYTPDISKSCKFKDISSVKGDLYTAIIESCQLGIMGQGISNFRPYDKITKGEVSTAISRIIRGSLYEGGNPYYTPHMNALNMVGVLDTINNPNTNELRGNVMMYLMRSNGILESNKSNIKSEETETLEAYNYFDSIASIAKEIYEKNKFEKNLSNKEQIQKNNDILKLCESKKNILSKTELWKGDRSLIDATEEYIESNITYLNTSTKYREMSIKIEKEMDEIEKLIDAGIKTESQKRLDEVKKMVEDAKSLGDEVGKLRENMDNKYKNITNISSNFLKKYCNQKYLKDIMTSKS